MAKGKMYVEKRKHERLEKEYDVSYKLMNKDMEKSSPLAKGKTQDLSMGGARIEGELVGNQNDIIRIEIKVENEPNPTTVLAEIKWIQSKNGNGQFGLAFLALQADEKATIEQILSGE